MYIATFKATGCTNDQPHIEWWKTQTDQTVLNDMFKYCELTKDGSGSGGQKSQCCGSEDCTVTECVKQTGWTKGNQIKKKLSGFGYLNYRVYYTFSLYLCNYFQLKH